MPSRRQARWIDLLQGYDLTWQYIQGKSNIADGMSRNRVVGAVQVRTRQTAVRQPLVPDFLSRVREAYELDTWFADEANLSDVHLEDGLYFRDGLLLIPDDSDLKAELLLEHHSSPCSGHPGREKTLKLLRRHVCWPHMAADVKHFVQHCDSCQRSKV